MVFSSSDVVSAQVIAKSRSQNREYKVHGAESAEVESTQAGKVYAEA